MRFGTVLTCLTVLSDGMKEAEPIAREIARRQGFQGVRWMKMTDPGALEAPSKVEAFLSGSNLTLFIWPN